MGKKSIDKQEALKDASLEVEEVDNIGYSDEEIALAETALNQNVEVVVSVENQDDIINLEAENLEDVVNSETIDNALAVVNAVLPKVEVIETGRLWRLIGGSHSFHCPQTGNLIKIRKGDLVRIEADTYDELPPWAKGKVQLAVIV